MPFIKRGKGKTLQYAVGGSIAAIVILAWMSIPLMQKSSLDTSVSYGRHFKGKTSNLRALGFGPEGQAPGSPLSGELIDNPATASGFVGSSLYQSQGWEMGAEAESADSALSSVKQPGSRTPSAASPPPASTPKGKLSMIPSLSGSGAGSSAKGIKSNRFFGTGNRNPEFASLEPLNKMGAPDRSGGGTLVLASLQKSEDASDKAAMASGLKAAGQGASSAFGAAKFDGSELGGEMEDLSGAAGLEMGQAAQDLKKSNPQNKHKITPPDPPEPSLAEKNDEMYKQMLIKMLISGILGPIFGSIGQMIAMDMNPNYKPTGTKAE